MTIKDGMGQYLRQIGRVPLLTADDEIILGRAVKEWLHDPQPTPEIEAKGRRAKEKLMAANLRLVVHLSKKYQNRGLEMEDLIQEGSIGLNRAVEKFDFTKGYKFSTYAYWWIRQALNRAIAEQSRTIRMPAHNWEKLSKVKAASREYLQRTGRMPSTEELSVLTEIPMDTLATLLEKFVQLKCASLDQKRGDDEQTQLIDFIPSGEPGTFETIIQENTKEFLGTLINELKDKEAQVIRMRFGLDDGKAKTLQAIADQIGLTRERIRQIEMKALKKLRQLEETKRFKGAA